MFGGKTYYLERKKIIACLIKNRKYSFGLPTQKQISGKQPKQTKKGMLAIETPTRPRFLQEHKRSCMFSNSSTTWLKPTAVEFMNKTEQKQQK